MTEERGDNFVFVCYKYYQNYSVYCYFFLYFDAVDSVKGIWTEESLCHLFPEVLLWTTGGGNWVTTCLKKTGKCLGKILSGKTVCCELLVWGYTSCRPPCVACLNEFAAYEIMVNSFVERALTFVEYW